MSVVPPGANGTTRRTGRAGIILGEGGCREARQGRPENQLHVSAHAAPLAKVKPNMRLPPSLAFRLPRQIQRASRAILRFRPPGSDIHWSSRFASVIGFAGLRHPDRAIPTQALGDV
jgi:hypothetical protein